MDIIVSLMNGILIALEPINLGLAIIGVVVGLFVGAMPGLGSVNGVAILLPFTFVIQSFTGGATSPMIFLAAIYYGAMYGGAISSITLGIPGRVDGGGNNIRWPPAGDEGDGALRTGCRRAGLICRRHCLERLVHGFCAAAGICCVVVR